MSSGEERAKLFIDNRSGRYGSEIVKGWFREANFQEPETLVDATRTVLFTNYRHDEQTQNRPNDARLIDAIKLLSTKDLLLMNEGIKNLFNAFKEVVLQTKQIKQTMGAGGDDISLYLNAFQGAFLGLGEYFDSVDPELMTFHPDTVDPDHTDEPTPLQHFINTLFVDDGNQHALFPLGRSIQLDYEKMDLWSDRIAADSVFSL